MSDINLEELITDKELEQLRGKCNQLEARMAAIMEELLEELEKQKCDERLECETKEGIKELTNKIFDLKKNVEE